MVGLLRERALKARHLATIWGMYVTAAARGKGVGAALLGAAIERARSWPGVVQLQLAVSTGAPEAHRLYRRLGFREWGLEPRALQHNGTFVDERHMLLRLD
jgi:GNAT superfamily N-acetyltransferase